LSNSFIISYENFYQNRKKSQFDKPGVTNYNHEMQNHFGHLIRAGSREEKLLKKINKKKIPKHVAIIMDGNGRWAKQHNLDRIQGHSEGAASAREIAECSARLGIKFLTLFVFSTENWKRPVKEVNRLMGMLYENLAENRDILTKNKIRLRLFGNPARLPLKLKKKLAETEDISRNHHNMQINLALNYGGRMEIIQAVKTMVENKIPVKKINEKTFQKYLYSNGCPDPELLIRSSGELRISNFMLFQIAYTELYFTDTLWPDFKTKQLLEAIIDYQNRGRRFGGI
jgi:undecaprenyl diphosphate synthase